MPRPTEATSVPRQVDSYLEWVTMRPASVWRWLLLLPIFGLTLILGPALALPLTLVLPDTEVGDLVARLSQFPGTLLVFAGLAALVLWRPVWMFAFRRRRPEWGLAGIGIAIQTVVTLLAMLAYFLIGVIEVRYETPDLGLLLVMVPIALVGLVVQTGTEEFITRGALPQMVFRITTNPVFVIGVPALLFAALHYTNVEDVGGGLFALLPYFATGALFGWLTWHTGSIWFAWGMHFANNALLSLFLGNEGDVSKPLSGLTFVFSDPSAWIFVWTDLAPTLLTGVVVWWLVIRRRPIMGRLARARRAETETAQPAPEPAR